jgi:hypothetical protein
LKAQAADEHIGDVLRHSERNGTYYIVSDLHMGFGRERPAGPLNRQEDFTRPDAFIKMLGHITSQPKNSTLVIAGDWLDILEHVSPSQGLGDVRAAISQIVKGHGPEFRALADAVVNKNLNVVYVRGNHDIRLTDASEITSGGATMRGYFLGEVAKAADLSPEQTKTFMSRVAYAGHMAPLGKRGELLVMHGNETDPANEWRSPQNPYSVGADGSRRIESNVGDRVVRDLFVNIELDDPNVDNRVQSSAREVAHDVLLNNNLKPRTMKLLHDVSAERGTRSPAQALAERLDDRAALRAWVRQTGFDKMAGMTEQQTVHALEAVYRESVPTPIHERMTSRSHFINAVRQMFRAHKTKAEIEEAEPHLLEALTTLLPNARYVTVGHDHKERSRVGNVEGKGDVGLWDTNTWTKTKGEDQLGVVVAHTDADGHITHMDRDGNLVGGPEAFRVNPATGKPEFPTRDFSEKRPVPNWGDRQGQ